MSNRRVLTQSQAVERKRAPKPRISFFEPCTHNRFGGRLNSLIRLVVDWWSLASQVLCRWSRSSPYHKTVCSYIMPGSGETSTSDITGVPDIDAIRSLPQEDPGIALPAMSRTASLEKAPYVETDVVRGDGDEIQQAVNVTGVNTRRTVVNSKTPKRVTRKQEDQKSTRARITRTTFQRTTRSCSTSRKNVLGCVLSCFSHWVSPISLVAFSSIPICLC